MGGQRSDEPFPVVGDGSGLLLLTLSIRKRFNWRFVTEACPLRGSGIPLPQLGCTTCWSTSIFPM